MDNPGTPLDMLANTKGLEVITEVIEAVMNEVAAEEPATLKQALLGDAATLEALTERMTARLEMIGDIESLPDDPLEKMIPALQLAVQQAKQLGLHKLAASMDPVLNNNPETEQWWSPERAHEGCDDKGWVNVTRTPPGDARKR
jgi:hypothetical protein